LHWFNTCNYSCPYCSEGKVHNDSPGEAWKPESVEKIITFFDKRPEQWEIELTGGEVTIHPLFIHLCQELSKRHKLNIGTNNSISFERLEEFISTVNKENVYLSCSLQSADEEDDRFTAFADRIKLMKDNGIKVAVSYVPTPERLGKLLKYKEYFDNLGVRFMVNVLFGDWNGKTYPADYSKDEFKTINDVVKLPAFMQYFLENGRPLVYGKPCDYGYTRIIIIGVSGDIMGCAYDNYSIGNIYGGRLNLSNQPRHCNYSFCSCPHLPWDVASCNWKEIYKSDSMSQEDLHKYYYEIARNPYFEGINLTPITQEDKENTLAILEKADKTGAMFYDSYKLQGSLYETLGKPKAAGRAYKKAIRADPRRSGNLKLKKRIESLTLLKPKKIIKLFIPHEILVLRAKLPNATIKRFIKLFIPHGILVLRDLCKKR
jgi:organic radical activating enzyme